MNWKNLELLSSVKNTRQCTLTRSVIALLGTIALMAISICGAAASDDSAAPAIAQAQVSGAAELSNAAASNDTKKKVFPTATFLQLNANLNKVSGSAWSDLLTYGSTLNYNTYIVQYVKDQNGSYFAPATYSNLAKQDTTDSVENILRAADSNNVKVYVGLFNSPTTTSSAEMADVVNLYTKLDAIEQSLAVTANDVKESYGHHSSFAGWYIPTGFYAMEFGKDDNRIKRLNTMLKNIASKCHTLKNVPVAISIFRGTSPPSDYATVTTTLQNLLSGSGVDEVFVQDQLGESFGQITCANMQSYFSSIKAACDAAKVACSPEIELFEHASSAGKDDRFPGHIVRISRQIDIANDFVSPNGRLATFDYLNYQNPTFDESIIPKSLAERKRLFSDFSRLVNARNKAGCDAELGVSAHPDGM